MTAATTTTTTQNDVPKIHSQLAQNRLVLLLLILVVCIIILSMGLETARECEGLIQITINYSNRFIEFGHGFSLFEIHLILIANLMPLLLDV